MSISDEEAHHRALRSRLILNPRNHCNSPLSAISKCFWISDLNFITSKIHFDITTMSFVTTAIIVCSFPDCLRYTEWSTADRLKPRLFVMTVVSVFCHSHLACFNPYKAVFSLKTNPCWPGFSNPASGSVYTSYLSGAFWYVLLMSTWCISQSCWAAFPKTTRIDGIFAAMAKVSS